ncbi:hypothetical protein [Serratia silvae]|uniref:OmpA-like domain-containing protein n=1 Tax=Serratia silvae TaxID=2824122 RepID=A0ABT0KER9_9GAMM|nr:hypothetical protein [Serratia silvae]MCL1030530.1 hypothetical protein [Serratia silvae]
MGLDFHVVFVDDEKNHFIMSELLHSSIFNSSTRWSSCKQLKKINDYYKSDVLLKNKDAILFVNDLVDISNRIDSNKDELKKILDILRSNEVRTIRVTGD